MNDADSELALWTAFVARVKLTFPFRVDVMIEPCDADRTSVITGDRRFQMAVELHVLERSTREPITVKTRQPFGKWISDKDAEELLFDLLDIAFRHEIYESVWIDGKLRRELHKLHK